MSLEQPKVWQLQQKGHRHRNEFAAPPKPVLYGWNGFLHSTQKRKNFVSGVGFFPLFTPLERPYSGSQTVGPNPRWGGRGAVVWEWRNRVIYEVALRKTFGKHCLSYRIYSNPRRKPPSSTEGNKSLGLDLSSSGTNPEAAATGVASGRQVGDEMSRLLEPPLLPGLDPACGRAAVRGEGARGSGLGSPGEGQWRRRRRNPGGLSEERARSSVGPVSTRSNGRRWWSSGSAPVPAAPPPPPARPPPRAAPAAAAAPRKTEPSHCCRRLAAPPPPPLPQRRGPAGAPCAWPWRAGLSPPAAAAGAAPSGTRRTRPTSLNRRRNALPRALPAPARRAHTDPAPLALAARLSCDSKRPRLTPVRQARRRRSASHGRVLPTRRVLARRRWMMMGRTVTAWGERFGVGAAPAGGGW